MRSQAGQWHYIRRNETTRQPRRHIFLDTEGLTARVRGGHEQTWRVGVAIFRDAPKGKAARESVTVYRSPAQLWKDVTAFVPAKGRVILWTHNLGYDVRISRALIELPALGWRLWAHNISPGSTWFTWRRDDQTLVMADSVNIFGTSLAQVSVWFGKPKRPLPAGDASMDAWAQRCQRDAEILHDAIVAYLAKLESDDLGNWQLTGSGQAWAAFRHKHLTHNMLVHWDTDARTAEHRAMWTGRCEAYWHGRLSNQQIDEWDMTLAYPLIATQCNVPTSLAAMLTGESDLRRRLARPDMAVLAEVDVTTTEPLVPADMDGRIAWPVGTFRTTLWDPELRLLIERGAGVTLVRGWVYRAEPALAQWAQWMVRELTADDTISPAWWKHVCKSWARALIGRLAMSYREWDRVYTSPRLDVRRYSYIDRDTGETGEVVQVGHDVFLATQTVDWPESMPMITGWVQSEARARLARLLLAVGDRVALYADTDSLIVHSEHYELMAQVAAEHPSYGLRLKRSWNGVDIRGPRQIVTGQRVRMSGIPIKAKRLPDGSIAGEVWQSLAGALTVRRATTVKITPRRWHLRAVDQRRTKGEDGWTMPRIVAA